MMAENLSDLARAAKIVERKIKVDRWVRTTVCDLVAERMKRSESDSPIPVIDGRWDHVNIEYDMAAWRKAIEFYTAVDRVRMQTGQQSRAVPTHDGMRSVTSSSIDDLAHGLLLFRDYFASDFGGTRPPTFLDMGCYDGRAVVLAHILGYKAEGIEIDGEAYNDCLYLLGILETEMPGIQRKIHVTQGDYTTAKGTKGLRTRLKHVDVFFNYDDSNVDKIAEVMMKKGKQGSRLLLSTYTERKNEIPLQLTHMIHTRFSIQTSLVDFPTYDVFERAK